MVAEGQPAPDFELPSNSGETVRLADLRGKPVVLYFYPRDERLAARSRPAGSGTRGTLPETGGRVFGVSPDSEESHAKFKQKYGLPFTLLADPDHRSPSGTASGSRRASAGKKYMGVERSTVVIGEDGTVEKVFRRVKARRARCAGPGGAEQLQAPRAEPAGAALGLAFPS